MPTNSKNSSKGLLIITQKVDLDDEALGFAHEWYAEFAKYFPRVSIICLQQGRHALPDNVSVMSLGKENGASRLTYLARLIRFSVGQRRSYDSVFVHMNPIYVVLMGLSWRLMGKKVALWYAHGKVSLKLRLAVAFAHTVFTSTSEGLRIDTPKRVIVGQGIDVERFTPSEPSEGAFTVVTVGRLTPSKGLDILIRAFSLFIEDFPGARFIIAGTPVTPEDKKYEEDLHRTVRKLGLNENIIFKGTVRNEDVPELLRESHLFVNASKTGSLDKAVLEAMATGVPALSSNDAVCELLRERWPRHCVAFDAAQFAAAMGVIGEMSREQRKTLGESMSEMVRSRFSVRDLIERIVKHMDHA